MLTSYLDHITIQTSSLENTKNFYITLLNLHVGYRPNCDVDGYWLYHQDHPIIHLVTSNDDIENNQSHIKRHHTGAIEHLAFKGDDYNALIETAQKNQWVFSEHTIPDLQIRQIFITDPNGIKLEIVFRNQ